MATYILNWNPQRWHWENFDEYVLDSANGQSIRMTWSCGNRKSIKVGDRVFLLRQGKNSPGIIASGVVRRGSFPALHWDRSRARKGHKTPFVDVDWDSIRSLEGRLSREELLQGLLPKSRVNTQVGGILVDPESARLLEKAWKPIESFQESLRGTLECNTIRG